MLVMMLVLDRSGRLVLQHRPLSGKGWDLGRTVGLSGGLGRRLLLSLLLLLLLLLLLWLSRRQHCRGVGGRGLARENAS